MKGRGSLKEEIAKVTESVIESILRAWAKIVDLVSRLWLWPEKEVAIEKAGAEVAIRELKKAVINATSLEKGADGLQGKITAALASIQTKEKAAQIKEAELQKELADARTLVIETRRELKKSQSLNRKLLKIETSMIIYPIIWLDYFSLRQNENSGVAQSILHGF